MPNSAAGNIKLVFTDVDGTLVTKQKVLTERASRAVQTLRDRGIIFAITSGRPPRGMEMLIKPLALDTPIAGFNGGMWTNPDLSLIEARTLPQDVAERTVALIEKDGLDVWLYSGESWMIRDKNAPHAAREEWTVKFAPQVVADFRGALDKVVKIVGVSDDLPRVEACEKNVQAALGNSASAARSQPYYLDVTHPEANKGFAVNWLSERLGIPLSQIATLGDQPNDVLMFKRSGVSIAMGNASEYVRGAATHVSTDCEEEGFARGIERFVLGEAHG
jgi:Cof subfamily protein (haloacid dehalogenase superfamily)